MAAEPFPQALEAVAIALDREDAIGAATAAEHLGVVWREIESTGRQLDAAVLREARALLARCEESAARLNATLRASLLQSSRLRRAIDSYQSP